VDHIVVSDWRGSPRLVVDSTDGSIVQRIDYDEFGAVTADTNPRFQPFAFQGGLADPDTGFVRFGARDYDPAIGRFTSRDPILFGGAQTNLYLFAGGDPVNGADPSGLGPSGPSTGDRVAGVLGNGSFVTGTLGLLADFKDAPGPAGTLGKVAFGLDVAGRTTSFAAGSGGPSHADPSIAQAQTFLDGVSSTAGVAGLFGGGIPAGIIGTGTGLGSKLAPYVAPPFYPVADAVGTIAAGGGDIGAIGANHYNPKAPTAPFIGSKF
jgi:RHS repeat-associated protein